MEPPEEPAAAGAGAPPAVPAAPAAGPGGPEPGGLELVPVPAPEGPAGPAGPAGGGAGGDFADLLGGAGEEDEDADQAEGGRADDGLGAFVDAASMAQLLGNAQGKRGDLERALALNMELQKGLKEKVAALRTALQENQDMQRSIEKAVRATKKVSVTFSKQSLSQPKGRRYMKLALNEDGREDPEGGGSRFIDVPCSRFFLTADGKTPAPNEEAKVVATLLEQMPTTFSGSTWRRHEIEGLQKGVEEAIISMRLKKVLANMPEKASLKNIEKTMQQTRKVDLESEEIMALFPKLNWLDISTRFVPSRKWESCKIYWNAIFNTTVNRGPWGADEDAKLKSLAVKHQQCDWQQIAQELGTKRTAAACLSRFQSTVDSREKKWTESEDRKLAKLVKKYPVGDWQGIASEMPGRDRTQVVYRWTKVLNPELKRGRWSQAEDDELRKWVGIIGMKWSEIQKHMVGRTDISCRERWCRRLSVRGNGDLELTQGSWSDREVAALSNLVEKQEGGIKVKWSWVAQEMEKEGFYRTDTQCRKKWDRVVNAKTTGQKGKGKKGKGKKKPYRPYAVNSGFKDDIDAWLHGSANGSTSYQPPAPTRVSARQAGKRKRFVDEVPLPGLDSDEEERWEDTDMEDEDEGEDSDGDAMDDAGPEPKPKAPVDPRDMTNAAAAQAIVKRLDDVADAFLGVVGEPKKRPGRKPKNPKTQHDTVADAIDFLVSWPTLRAVCEKARDPALQGREGP